LGKHYQDKDLGRETSYLRNRRGKLKFESSKKTSEKGEGGASRGKSEEPATPKTRNQDAAGGASYNPRREKKGRGGGMKRGSQKKKPPRIKNDSSQKYGRNGATHEGRGAGGSACNGPEGKGLSSTGHSNARKGTREKK